MALVNICVANFLVLVCQISNSHAMLNQRHETWMSQHGRVYKDEEEKIKRFEIFKNNVRKIEAFNAGSDQGYKLGINAFADMTREEIRAFHTGYKRQITPKIKSQHNHFRYANVTSVPSTMDWRKKRAVTPVKNQGDNCGSCWAFSAVGAVEGIHQIKTGKLVSLSEQELMDCDRGGVDKGCHGGLMSKAFEFIVKNKGLRKESDYPYTASDDDTCNNTKRISTKASVRITGYERVPKNDENALLLAVAHQPVSVAVAGASDSFRFYSSGVIGGGCGTFLDHGVVVVGYGRTKDGTKYWLAKNSWGENWGEKGYVRVKRGVSDKRGLCGIAMDASYPTLD